MSLSYILSSPIYVSSPNTIILKQPLGEKSEAWIQALALQLDSFFDLEYKSLEFLGYCLSSGQ